MKSININNYEETLWFSRINHDCYCEYRIPRHALMYVQSGQLLVEKNGEKITVNPNEYVFVKRDCAASISKLSVDDMPYRSIAVTLTRDYLKTFYNQHQSNIQQRSKQDTPLHTFASILHPSTSLRSLFNSLVPYAEEGINPSPDLLHLKLEEAVLCLIESDPRMIPTLFDFRETWKIDLLGFMEEHYTQDLTLQEFALYTGRSLATFKRDFSKISDVTPQKWLIGKRLQKARELVRNGQCRPSEVYASVGFRNRSHFATAFKEHFGCTPSSLFQTVCT